jgi:hypothetical protein
VWRLEDDQRGADRHRAVERPSDGVIQSGVANSPATRVVTPAVTTTYTVTAVADANCTGGAGTGSAVVTVNPPPTASVSGNALICAGGSRTISAVLTGTGPWNVTWSDGVIQSGVASSPATRVVTPAVTTTYTVTAVADANCTGGAGAGNAAHGVNPPPTATVSGSALICAGASRTISAALTGTGPWTVSWSDGVIQSGVLASPATRMVNPTVTTTYTVTAVADVNCTGGAGGGSAVVAVNPLPTASVSGSAPLCVGGASCC